MTGGYLEMQINGYIIGLILAFRKYIFSDVIPAFGNLNKRADDVANEYYNKIGAQPVWGDSRQVAELVSNDDLAPAVDVESIGGGALPFNRTATRHGVPGWRLYNAAAEGYQLGDVKKWYATHLRLHLETWTSWALATNFVSSRTL